MPADDLRQAVRDLMPRAKSDLAELVAFRSVADPRQYPPRGARTPRPGWPRRSPPRACTAYGEYFIHRVGHGMTHIDDLHFPHSDHCDDHGPTAAVAETSTGG